MAFGPKAPAPNGNGEPAPPKRPIGIRRGDDDPGTDFRYVRRLPSGDGGGSSVVTAAMVSLAVAVLVAGAGWLGFTRGEIDRSLAPLREDIAALASAHGRLDDRVTRDLQELDRDKIGASSRREMLDDLNRRLATIDRAIETNANTGHLVLQQVNAMTARLEELRQRLAVLERRERQDYQEP